PGNVGPGEGVERTPGSGGASARMASPAAMFERSYDPGGARPPAGFSLARVEYELQLHAALLRTMRAMLQTQRVQRELDHPALSPIIEELGAIDHHIAELPPSAEARPMLALARRLGCGEHEIGFLWTAVALA